MSIPNSPGAVLQVLREHERKINTLMYGCPIPVTVEENAQLFYFNVLGVAGSNKITDKRLVGWEVVLIAIDNQLPRSTGFTKIKTSDTINLTGNLIGGEVITLFLNKLPRVVPPVPPATLFPYQFPIDWGSGGVTLGFPYALPLDYD